MEYYETQDDYTEIEVNSMLAWFDANIGTDQELNESASGEPDAFYVVFFDLLMSEVKLIREYENKFRLKHKKDM